MVMVRWVGACAAERLAACDRATARSMDAAVANRCAAPMNASASCDVVGALGLTQQRRDAGQHLVVGHSAKLREAVRHRSLRQALQPFGDPRDHVVEHLLALRLVEDLVVEPGIDLQLDVARIPRTRPGGGCRRRGSAGRRSRVPPAAARSVPARAAAWSRRPAAAPGRHRRAPCRGRPAGRSGRPPPPRGRGIWPSTSRSVTGRPGRMTPSTLAASATSGCTRSWAATAGPDSTIRS